MKLLITGGAGFIGSNYVHVHHIARPNDELVILDALTYSGKREHLTDLLSDQIRLVEGRIEDRDLVRKLFETERFDAVIHFAAESHVDRSISHPEIFITTNVLGTQVLLDAARDFNVSRFHHISTDEVYGDLGFNSHGEFKESDLLKPSNPYSASKAASDLMVLAYRRTFGLPVTLSRCSNNFGPFQSEENFIPLCIQRALNGEALPLYGKGLNVRDWLFVTDHCSAILAILERGHEGEIYNVGGGGERPNLEVAQEILKLTGQPESLITFVEDRKGHDERYAISSEKLKNDLQWERKTSFDAGLRFTLEWFKTPKHERSYPRWRDRISALATH